MAPCSDPFVAVSWNSRLVGISDIGGVGDGVEEQKLVVVITRWFGGAKPRRGSGERSRFVECFIGYCPE